MALSTVHQHSSMLFQLFTFFPIKTIYKLVPSLLLCLLLFFDTSHAHSFLINPFGDFLDFRKPECRLGGPPHAPNDSCPGPCFSLDSWQYNKQASFTIVRRNQPLQLEWTKNNHKGGFVRFALVPVHLRMDKAAHKRYAFFYSCFEAGQSSCQYALCGTDVNKLILGATVRVPQVFPDGDYVLGWAWFGGYEQLSDRRESMFGDYWSCSFVRVRGGPINDEFVPLFQPGVGVESDNSCLATVDRLGVCASEPCYGRTASPMVPHSFANGAVPPAIRRESLEAENTRTFEQVGVAGGASPEASASPSVSVPIQGSEKHGRPTAGFEGEVFSAQPLGSATGTQEAEPVAQASVAAFPQTGPIATPLVLVQGLDWQTRPSATPSSTPADGTAALVGMDVLDIRGETVVAREFPAAVIVSCVGNATTESERALVSFVTRTAGRVREVEFYVNTVFTRVERWEPYTAFGNERSLIWPWPEPVFGRWTNVTTIVRGDGGESMDGEFLVNIQCDSEE